MKYHDAYEDTKTMMIRLMTMLLFLLPAGLCQAQVLQPVDWQFSARKIAENTYEVRLTATVDEPWAIYAVDTPEGGPLPTTITFQENPMVLHRGKTRQLGKLHRRQDRTFGVEVHYFTGKVAFIQVVRLRAPVKTQLSGTVEYMACDKERCLPPQVIPFTLMLP